MTYIDLGLIDGNFFNAAHVDSIEAAINKGVLAAEVRMYAGATEPTGWKFVNGQVLVNAQGLFPDFWAVIPASWKSGSNATLPNMAASFPVGQDGTHALGAAGGANTHTLVAGNLPPHAHAIDHDHGLVTTTGQSTTHTHGVFPQNASGTEIWTYFVVQNPSGTTGFTGLTAAGGTVGNLRPAVTDLNNVDHTHNVDLPNFTGSSGNGPGASTAVDHTPKWVGWNYIIKVH